MAVEIRELVIRAVIVDDNGSEEEEAVRGAEANISKEEIIQECVNQVLKILSKSKYR